MILSYNSFWWQVLDNLSDGYLSSRDCNLAIHKANDNLQRYFTEDKKIPEDLHQLLIELDRAVLRLPRSC